MFCCTENLEKGKTHKGLARTRMMIVNKRLPTYDQIQTESNCRLVEVISKLVEARSAVLKNK